jgi:hypothetical protein
MSAATIDQFEILVDVHRITERRGGAVYRTEFVERRWVPMAQRGHTVGDEQYCSLSSDCELLCSETIRRTQPAT